jgi:hypothetical protein
MTLLERASEKISSNLELNKYRSILLADYPYDNDHLEWILKTDTNDLIAWAKWVEVSRRMK